MMDKFIYTIFTVLYFLAGIGFFYMVGHTFMTEKDLGILMAKSVAGVEAIILGTVFLIKSLKD